MAADGAWPVLVDDDLVLRVLRPDDAPAWHVGEDEEQRRWFEVPGPAPYENVVAAIGRWRSSWAGGGRVHHWGIWTAEVGLAGGVELRDRGDRKVNVSYVVFPPARRRGLATRAVRLATDWAFANLPVDAAVAIIDERNVASRAVARSAGFALDGPAERWEHRESGPMLRFVLDRPAVR
jgi:RimJ/RimL family protein N-acetyltransferase